MCYVLTVFYAEVCIEIPKKEYAMLFGSGKFTSTKNVLFYGTVGLKSPLPGLLRSLAENSKNLIRHIDKNTALFSRDFMRSS